jgi:hypothetical protein
MASIKRRVFTFGFVASCIAVFLFAAGTLLSPNPNVIIICLWHNGCEGGEISAIYQVGVISYFFLNVIPAVLIAQFESHFPIQAVPFAAAVAGAMVIGSALWWLPIAAIVERTGLLSSKLRVVVAILTLALILLAINAGIILYIEKLNNVG